MFSLEIIGSFTLDFLLRVGESDANSWLEIFSLFRAALAACCVHGAHLLFFSLNFPFHLYIIINRHPTSAAVGKAADDNARTSQDVNKSLGGSRSNTDVNKPRRLSMPDSVTRKVPRVVVLRSNGDWPWIVRRPTTRNRLIDRKGI